MSSEHEDPLSLPSPMESSAPISDQKKPRIRYTRDFFLSLSELDACKKLPSGLDKSILSDLEEATNTAFERQRSVGNLSLHGSRRGEYGSLSLNRSENSNSYTKGISSRWDTRSSGSSDREGDLLSDRESFTQDSGRRFGNQNRRTWQDPEHDGLLGSGALARTPGFTGASASKARGNGHYQLNKSTEPYQPPRPYKAAPYSRKDGSDLCNDETFGSSECSNVDRAEEERKRRESFELMRKEQQKTLQEKHSNDIHKGNLDLDITVLLDNSDADKSTQSTRKPDECVDDSLSPCNSTKSSPFIHVPATRPLVPPGFASMLMEKNNQINKLKSVALQSADEAAPSSIVPGVGFGNISFNTSVIEEASEVWEEDMPIDSFHKKEAGSDIVEAATQDHSSSIFDKLFGKAFVKNSGGLASDIQNHVNKAGEETWTHVASDFSKFAHLFQEESEESMPTEDKSSRDLLSLFVNNDNFGSQVYISSNDEAAEKNQSGLPSENATVHLSSPAPCPITGTLLESYQGDEQRPCAVLTCEDLEQSILAEVEDRCSVMQSLQDTLIAVDAKSEEHRDVVNDHASHHLLSLLLRGENSKESLEPPRVDVIGSHDMLACSDVESSTHFQLTNSAASSLSETEQGSEKRLTLEALFGAAFMNELHSMEAPISAQKTLVGRVNDRSANQSHGLPFYPPDSLTTTSNELHSKKAVFEGEMLQSNSSAEHARAQKSRENWTDYRDSPLHGFKLGDLTFEQSAGDIHLPEEDSLISLNDSLDAVASDSLCFQQVNRNDSLVPEKTVGDLSNKLLHTILRVGEPSREPAVDYPSFIQVSREMGDPDGDYHHLHVRPPLQFSHQMNHGKPLSAAHLDHPTLRNSQMNFISPDVMYHDPHHPFVQNVFTHNNYNSNSGPQLDPTTRHHMLSPIPFPGNFPPHNSVQGLPRVSHPINHLPGFSHEMNNVHVFPQQHQQPNYGDRGMGMPGHGGGGAAGRRSQEALERLMEMEMRANAKQFRPSMAEHVPGMYGADLDMNLQYMR
ncbi:uncharacterized protein LOC110112411 [Dendrobium catenatum]|uniref:Uncharacterized protein n=1 Tax=Dendrobium catenatum TaxID=906689 RepID=A0A2I0X6R3_9ASPA|nr:uncharacterized protein LOC110112411 [Dendrobium catenatum]XP_020700286.1 uncharacterized protein LOC110112411 [Dendrobium catenatum]XP_028549238.1 uncharacterized protein LOC110112411 [Dendrobium catenatum]PKU83592.1 hypothetical protein MA16_Dca021348 [Dendrobium catenatum]